MSSSSPKKFSRSRVTTGILVNLTATPGLGSVMCGRLWAGLGQLAFSVSGFCLITVWMLRLMYGSMIEQMGDVPPTSPPSWMWKCGVALFGAGWLWSLFTSISLWKAEQANVPPRITNRPPKM